MSRLMPPSPPLSSADEPSRWTLAEAAAKLRSRAVGVRELAEICLTRIAATEPEIHACLSVMAAQAREEADRLDREGPDPARPLWGVPLTVKDNFCTKGTRTTCASRMLENYVPPYDAAVVEKLRAAGAVIIAKTNLDEFAMGCSTEFSAFGPSKNPWDASRVPGGSSGGAAASVAAGQTFGGFGTDTGGSIRQPAALCGCVGLKPSYGRVSRYGMTAFASSFDQAGPLARRVLDCAMLLAAVAGPDERDSTAAPRPVDDYAAAFRPKGLKGARFGVPREFWEGRLSPEVEGVLTAALKKIEAAGAEARPVSIPHLPYSVAAYYLMATAEASTNLARFDGVRYGARARNPKDLHELYVASRSANLGPEVKRRILLGAFALSAGYYDAYYKKAAQVRRILRDEHLTALADVDALLTPISPFTAWPFGHFDHDPVTAYQLDIMTLPANLAGLPALSMPAGLGSESGLPVGLQLVGRPFDEAGLIAAGRALEEILPPLA